MPLAHSLLWGCRVWAGMGREEFGQNGSADAEDEKGKVRQQCKKAAVFWHKYLRCLSWI